MPSENPSCSWTLCFDVADRGFTKRRMRQIVNSKFATEKSKAGCDQSSGVSGPDEFLAIVPRQDSSD